MSPEYDPRKDAKHGVSVRGDVVLGDTLAITVEDYSADDGARWVTIGDERVRLPDGGRLDSTERGRPTNLGSQGLTEGTQSL
jgi:hypothetical protein